MIQIAIVSDIHANIVAFEAILENLKERSIDQIYCLGDLVDFAPWGNEVITLIRKRGIPCILGNHDERIAFDQPIVPLSHHDEIETSNREKAITLSKKTISEDNKKWLAGLPFRLELTFKIKESFQRILLVHATVTNNDKYVYEGDSKESLVEAMGSDLPDAIVMGHTHMSYVQQQDGVLFVNSGSVGRSREKDRKAAYTILTITETGVEAEICKINYDVARTAAAIYASDVPDFYGDFLLHKSV